LILKDSISGNEEVGLVAAIQKLDDQYATAFNTGDAAAIASLYKDNAVILTPGAEMVKADWGARRGRRRGQRASARLCEAARPF